MIVKKNKKKLKLVEKPKLDQRLKKEEEKKINLDVTIGISNEGALAKKRGISPIPP